MTIKTKRKRERSERLKMLGRNVRKLIFKKASSYQFFLEDVQPDQHSKMSRSLCKKLGRTV